MIALVLALLFSSSAPAQERYVHESPGFELELPSAEWAVRDMGGGSALVLVFTPVQDMMTRCSVLRFPGSFLPEGLETREQQIRAAAGELYRRVSLEPGRIAEREPYELDVEIAIDCSGGSPHRFQVTSRTREESFDFELPAAPAAARLEPRDRLPARLGKP